MDYQQALAFIHSRHAVGQKVELRNITHLLERLGNPHKQLKFVHVAGTNGKGSTSTYTAAALTKAGYHTGLFISPYVIEFRERIQLDGQMIPKEELAQVTASVKEAVESLDALGERCTEFETVTAIAMVWYARKQADIVVLEVGLGGRIDPTNVIDRALVSVITSIGYDHTDVLGDTLGEIAAQKCGIFRPGGRVVAYPNQAPEAMAVIKQKAVELSCALTLPDPQAAALCKMDLFGEEMDYKGLSLRVPLIGKHQILNCITAVETLFQLRELGFVIPDAAIQEGIAGVRFPARMEVLCRDPLVILDGAHNPSGLAALASALDLVPSQRVCAVIAMMRDKDCEQALSLLLPKVSRVMAVSASNPRSHTGESLAAICRRYCGQVDFRESAQEGLKAALIQLEPGEALVICGSLYLASDLRPIAKELAEASKTC